MSDELNGLRKLFSDREKDEETPEKPVRKDGDTPDEKPGFPERDLDSVLGDIRHGGRRFGSEDDSDDKSEPERFVEEEPEVVAERPDIPESSDVGASSGETDDELPAWVQGLEDKREDRMPPSPTPREPEIEESRLIADDGPVARPEVDETPVHEPAAFSKREFEDTAPDIPPEVPSRQQEIPPVEGRPMAAHEDETRAGSDETPGREDDPPHMDESTVEEAAQDVTQLRDLVFKNPLTEDIGKPRKKNKALCKEPTVQSNPLFSFIGLVGALCIGAAFVMTLLGAKASLGLTGLSGAGVVLLIGHAVGNRKNLKLVLSARSTRYGTNVALVIGVLLAILVVLNGISYGHYYVIDMTSNKANSLSEQTLTKLAELKQSGKTVVATAFITRDPKHREMGETLEFTLKKYARELPNMEITYLDPDINAQTAEKLGFVGLPIGVVFELGDKHEKAVEFANDSGWWEYEGAMTNALFRLTGTYAKRVYFLTGHYELAIDDYSEGSDKGIGLVAEELTQLGFQVEKLSLSNNAEIPADCNLLVVAGPDRELPAREIDAIKRYLDTGGRVILLLENRNGAGFTPMLEEYGVHYRADLIVDNINNQYGSNNLHPLLEMNSHPINAPLKSRDMKMAFFRASGIDVDSDAKKGWVLDRLLSTKAGGSWSETGDDEDFIMDDDEDRGPFTMAVLAGKPIAPVPETEADGEEPEAERTGRDYGLVLVTGDASFAANSNLGIGGSKDFILNAIGFMTSDVTDITIRASEPPRYLKLSKNQVNIAFLASTIFIPLLIAAMGILVWARRK